MPISGNITAKEPFNFGVISVGGSSYDPATDPNALWMIDADEANNTTVQRSSTFETTDVDTTNNRINVNFGTDFIRTTEYQSCLCTFSTTNTLPTGLVAGTEYILENDGSGHFYVYKKASNADYADFDTYEDGENIVPNMYYQCGEYIEFSDTGSGTHTVTVLEYVTGFHDAIDGSNIFEQTTLVDTISLRNDPTHGNYFDFEGGIGGFAEPQGKKVTTNRAGTEIYSMHSGSRYVYTMMIGTVDDELVMNKARAICEPADVTAGTGVFFSINHQIKTGTPIDTGVLWKGGAFPTPTVAFAATVYARAVDLNNVTLHPSEADANANTNSYTFSDTGSGIFCIAGRKDVQVHSRRRMLLDVSITSNDHAYAPCEFTARDVFDDMSAGYHFLNVGGGNASNNGAIMFWIGADAGGTSDDIFKVKIFIPSGTTAVTCTDTGLPLETGEYWMTYEPGTNWNRLHRTLANAQAAVGVATASIPNDTDIIRYSALGDGMAAGGVIDTVPLSMFDDGFNWGAAADNPAPVNDWGVFFWMNDFEDPSGKRNYYAGRNGEWNYMDAADGSYNTPMPTSTSSSLTLANTGQPHVTYKGKAKLIVTFKSDTKLEPAAMLTMAQGVVENRAPNVSL